MDESKHIPGPWRADDNGDGTHCITAGRGCDVAHTCSASNEEANARLIAAAPDLLAALESLVERIEKSNGWDQRGDGLSEARAAIAKAKG